MRKAVLLLAAFAVLGASLFAGTVLVNAAAVGPSTFVSARCAYSNLGSNDVVVKCYVNPADLNASSNSGASWGYTVSSWDARADATISSSNILGQFTGTSWQACGGGTVTAKFHDAHPDLVASAGVVYVGTCPATSSTLDDGPSDSHAVEGCSIVSPFDTGFVFAKCYWRGLRSDVASAPYPADWFPGGSEFDPVVPEFCADLGVHVNFYDNTVAPGSSFQLVLTSSLSAGSDVELRSHWLRSSGGPLRHLVDGAVVALPLGSSPWTIDVQVPAAYGPIIPRNDWTLSCTSSTTIASFTADGTAYVARGARTCDALATHIRWPSFPLQPSTISTMGLTIPSGVLLLDDDGITALSWSDWTDPTAVSSTSITTIRNGLGIIRSYPILQGDGVTFDISSPSHVVTKDNFALTCTDSTGDRVWPAGNKPNPENVLHPINEEVITPADASDRYSACMDDLPSMQLTDPGSWVEGIAGMAMCLFQLIFVPTNPAIEYLKTAATAATTHAPISYISQGATFLYGAVAGAPSAVAAHDDDDLVLFGGHIVAGQAPITGNFDSLGASMTTPRMIIGVLFWLGSVWVLFAMTMRRVRP